MSRRRAGAIVACCATLASILWARPARAQRNANGSSIAPASAAEERDRPATRVPHDEDGGLTVIGARPMSAASSQTVRDRDLRARPHARPADLFEVAPGLIAVQHAGGGKADQYFLRGFDADHGTDIAFSVDEVPINLVTHAHGQGYSDPHFLIPELVDRVDVREGPYFARDGDFATAGAINLHLRDTVDRDTLTYEQTLVANPALGTGMLNNERVLGIARTEAGPVRGYLAGEFAHTDGPFLHPLDFNHYNAVGHWHGHPLPGLEIALTLMSYGGAWNASGQIPATLVGQPYMGRTFSQFDAIDPSEGGNAQRQQASITVRARPTDTSTFDAMAYVVASRLALFSNFTFYLNDPVHGDEIEQDDARTITGFRTTWRDTHSIRSWHFVTTIGTAFRYDAIDNGLRHVERRQRLEDLVVDHVNETSLGLFAEEQVIPTSWLRFVLGVRGDVFAFDVHDERAPTGLPDPTRNGDRAAPIVSPKATMVLSPIRSPRFDLDVYLNFGRGFHSNDARGVVIPSTPTLAMQCANAMSVPSGTQCPVTPLTAATGYEIGTRARVARAVDLSVAAWWLDLDAETVWNGDTGTTEVAGPTRRYGVTFEARARIVSWLWADADVSLVHAAFVNGWNEVGAVPLAPPWVVAAGVTAIHPSGPYGSIRLRAIGDRPADPMGRFTAQGFAIVSMQTGYRHRWFDVGVRIENLLDSNWREAQFEEDYRIAAGAPPETGIKFTPGEPLSVTLSLTARLP